MIKRVSTSRVLTIAGSFLLAIAMAACGGDKPAPIQDEAPPVTRTPQATQTDTAQAERDRQAELDRQAQLAREREAEAARNARKAPEGKTASHLFLPTGKEDSSVLEVTSIAPESVQAGFPFDYSIKATNLTDDYELRNVIVTQEVPGTYTIRASDPAMQPLNDQPMGEDMELISFYVGELGPGQSKTINVNAVANEEGRLIVCSTATYEMYVCWATDVVKPEISVTKSGPSEVLLCDPIVYEIVVRNEGSGEARGIVMTDTLPEGLQTDSGQTTVRNEIGTLAPGEEKSYTINARANATGQYVNVADVAGEGIVAVSNPVTTTVRMPILELTKTAPRSDYVNSRYDYRISLTNAGDATATNVQVVDNLPSGVEFISASQGGEHSAGTVTWNVGNLAAGDSRDFTITVRANEMGIMRNEAEVTADCALEDEARTRSSALTEIIGIAAVVLEVVDEEDPVKVGQDTVYRLTVRNQGSAAMTNIRLDLILEKQTYVSAEGPTPATIDGELVKLEPYPSLGVGEEVTWRVRVTATESGDVRFRVNMVSDQLERPVRETESTFQYTEGELN